MFLSMQLLLNMIFYKEIYTLSLNVFYIFNANIFFTILGILIYEFEYSKRNNNLSIGKKINLLPKLNIKFLLPVQVVIVLISIHYYNEMKYLTLLRSDIARELFFTSFFSSYFELLFYYFFIINFKYISSFLIAFIILKSKTNLLEKILLFLSVLHLLLIGATSLSRMDFLIPIIYILILAFIIPQKISNVSRKNIFRKVVFIIILGIICIIAITLLRVNLELRTDNFTNDIFILLREQFIDYFSFPITAFDFWLNNIYNNHVQYLYVGKYTLNGIFEIIQLPFKFLDDNINFADISSISDFVANNNSIYGKPWNALYSGILPYYMDFNILGVIIYPFIIGSFLAKFTYSIHKNEFNISSILLYLFFLYSLFKNIMNSAFQSTEFWFFLILYFFIKTKFQLFQPKINTPKY